MKDIKDILKISNTDYSSNISEKISNVNLTENNFLSKDLFKVVIHKIKIKEWQQNKSRILSLVPFDSKKTSNTDEVITYTDYFKESTDVYEKELLKLLKPYLNDFRYQNENSKFKIVKYSHVWCQKYLNADWHPPHDHGAMGLSCIFYAHYNSEIHKPTQYTSPFPDVTGIKMGTSPSVEEGELVLFPSFLTHTAPPSGVNKERIIFSFNALLDYTEN